MTRTCSFSSALRLMHMGSSVPTGPSTTPAPLCCEVFDAFTSLLEEAGDGKGTLLDLSGVTWAQTNTGRGIPSLGLDLHMRTEEAQREATDYERYSPVLGPLRFSLRRWVQICRCN
uniref:Uncharacterized protein n=1 Tax=Nelumbo nucifera TaxID=4432 RepID=A0A822YAB4_NELNU|nr:TPA_asm: hypothetical protein HUJ06_029525 [Nelumbo nucifera]